MITNSQTLDTLTCSINEAKNEKETPGILYFHGRCHIESPTWTFYNKKTKTLTIECAECRTQIVEVKVAATS